LIDILIDIALLTFLSMTAVAIVRISNLFAIIMLFGIFSFLSATMFMIMDAVDVALTEAAVGAGISTVLMLATLALTKDHEEKRPSHRPWLPLAVVVVTGAALVYGTWDIPAFGDPEAPAQKHVAPYYIDKSYAETGVPNMVTAVLASYRGFDTLGEVVVILTAGIAVLLLLGDGRIRAATGGAKEKRIPQNLILRVVSKTVIPMIILFALYVQFHGDYSPGGGFQAGVIMSAALILYSLVFGLEAAERIIPKTILAVLTSLGVLVFAGVGIAALFLGGNFLDYSVLADTPLHGQHLGILLVEFGVGITVFSVMLTIFFAFARGRAS
jgi:multicomponent Na+:H+ antiporter subunit B